MSASRVGERGPVSARDMPGGWPSVHCRGGDMFTMSFKSRLKIVPTGECAILLMVRLDHFQHGVRDATRFSQSLCEPGMLFFIREKAVFKCSHGAILLQTMGAFKQERDAPDGGAFHPMSKARGSHATLWEMTMLR